MVIHIRLCKEIKNIEVRLNQIVLKPHTTFFFSTASDSAKGVWFNNVDLSQNVESTSISPRPLKKLSTSLKNVPRRSIRQESLVDTPPESPTQVTRRK